PGGHRLRDEPCQPRRARRRLCGRRADSEAIAGQLRAVLELPTTWSCYAPSDRLDLGADPEEPADLLGLYVRQRRRRRLGRLGLVRADAGRLAALGMALHPRLPRGCPLGDAGLPGAALRPEL